MSRFIPLRLVCLALLLVTVGCGGSSRSLHLERGLEIYRTNALEEALPHVQLAVLETPKDPDSHAWAAEILRRLGRGEEAYREARQAVALSPCHAFGHVVLGDLFNPRFQDIDRPDAEVAWEHYLQAATCDPTDGNVWLGVWAEAVLRHQANWEREALQGLSDSEFFTPSLLNYNRWVLSGVPQGAILLTSGDMDTYPALVLQEVETFRPDVAVINLPLLELSEYRDAQVSRHGLPHPEDSPLETYVDEEGAVVTAAYQLVDYWTSLGVTGLGRSLAMALTVNRRQALPPEAELQFMGTHFELRGPDGAEVSADGLARAAAAISPDDFTTPFVSEQDRSAVRQSSSGGLADNLILVAMRYASALVDAGDWDGADTALAKAEELSRHASGRLDFTQELTRLRKRVDDERS